MPSSDRDRSIRDHLAKTSSGLNFTKSAKPSESPRVEAPVPITPPPTTSFRKSSVMEHLYSSTKSDFKYIDDEAKRKKKIMDHLRSYS